MSKIEWTDLTRNLTSGCTPISPGCKNCYAEKFHNRLRAMGHWKYKEPFNRVVMHWNCIDDLMTELDRMKPRKIFLNSMSDLFHPEVSDSFIREVLIMCGLYPRHTFQILTKRAERLEDFNFRYPPNVWLGVTIEGFSYLDRMTDLLKTDARVKFISCEPLLEALFPAWWTDYFSLKELHWIIAGGETGPGARAIKKEWVTIIRDSCIKEKVPFFFKQWNRKKDNLIDGKAWKQFPEPAEMNFNNKGGK